MCERVSNQIDRENVHAFRNLHFAAAVLFLLTLAGRVNRGKLRFLSKIGLQNTIRCDTITVLNSTWFQNAAIVLSKARICNQKIFMEEESMSKKRTLTIVLTLLVAVCLLATTVDEVGFLGEYEP